jgi:kynurenine formamidase
VLVELIDLSKYRIIDRSVRLTPGVHSVNQEYIHGKELRKLEIRQFICKPDNTFMYWIDTETHIGTYVEDPVHYIEGCKSACDIPLESYFKS